MTIPEFRRQFTAIKNARNINEFFFSHRGETYRFVALRTEVRQNKESDSSIDSETVYFLQRDSDKSIRFYGLSFYALQRHTLNTLNYMECNRTTFIGCCEFDSNYENAKEIFLLETLANH